MATKVSLYQVFNHHRKRLLGGERRMSGKYKTRLLIKKKRLPDQQEVKICLNCKYEDLVSIQYPCDDCLHISGVFNWEAKTDELEMVVQ